MKRMLTTKAAATLLDSPFQELVSASWYSAIPGSPFCHPRLDRGSQYKAKL